MGGYCIKYLKNLVVEFGNKWEVKMKKISINEVNSKFIVPIQVKKEKEQNEKIRKKLIDLSKRKPMIYKDDIFKVLDWVGELISLYKLMK